MVETVEGGGAARFAPGTYGCHEALHIAAVLAAMVDRELAEHPAVKANPAWKALADRASDALGDLYQAIGAEHPGAEAVSQARAPAARHAGAGAGRGPRGRKRPGRTA